MNDKNLELPNADLPPEITANARLLAESFSPSEASSKETTSDKDEEGRTPITLACCGMNCTECRFAVEDDCPGCMCGKIFEDEECEILTCCTEKEYINCAKCPDFPCDTLKAVSYDKETGDGGGRLIRLKAIRDKEYREKSSLRARIIGGICIGIAVGVIIGGFSGAAAAWIFAGIVVGGGLGIISVLAEKK